MKTADIIALVGDILEPITKVSLSEGLLAAFKRMVQLANSHAETHHMLLALLEDRGCSATRALARAEIDLKELEQEVRQIDSIASYGHTTLKASQISPRLTQVINLADDIAVTAGGPQIVITTTHVLGAILSLQQGCAYNILVKCGVSPDIVPGIDRNIRYPEKKPHAA